MIILDIIKLKLRLNQRVNLLEKTLRETNCPRPANGEPSDQTAGECCDRGLCGCHVGAALAKEVAR